MSISASEDMDFLAAGIEAIDPARAGPVAASLRDGEKIALLPTAAALGSRRVTCDIMGLFADH